MEYLSRKKTDYDRNYKEYFCPVCSAPLRSSVVFHQPWFFFTHLVVAPPHQADHCPLVSELLFIFSQASVYTASVHSLVLRFPKAPMQDIPTFFFRGISWFQLDLPLAISPSSCLSKCYCLLSLTTNSAYALPGSRLPVSVRCLHAFALLRGIAIPSAHLMVSRQEKQSTNMSVFAVCFPASSLILCLLSLYHPPAHFWSICLTTYLTLNGLQFSASQALLGSQRNCLAQNELLPVSVGIFHLVNLSNCQPAPSAPGSVNMER